MDIRKFFTRKQNPKGSKNIDDESSSEVKGKFNFSELFNVHTNTEFNRVCSVVRQASKLKYQAI